MKPTRTANSPIANKNILIIDDDKGLLRILSSNLETEGCKVLVAETGEEGLKIAQAEKPDIILLDVILPGLKGREVCAQLKENRDTKDIPVIFLTAKDSPDDVKAEMEIGAVAHLTKPVDSRKLVAEIKHILR